MRKTQAGFTLLELLIALMLAGFLCIVLFTALRIGGATLNRVSAVQANIDDDLGTQQMLTRWLENAYPKYIPPGVSGLTGHVEFDGEANSISFISAQAPLSIAPAGMAYMHVWFASQASPTALMMSARPELGWPGQTQVTQETVLNGVSAVDFAYFGSDAPDGRKYWRHIWKNRLFLPSLIRLRVKFSSGAARKWPDLLIAPQIDADQSCQFLQVTQSCLGR